MSTETGPRRVGRPALALAALVLAGSTAWLGWWTTTLSGLPDIGDPFDVESFAPPIPDATNAFVLYREAFARLGKEPADMTGVWASAGLEERRWLEASREALGIWRQGTARPDALYISPRTMNVATLLPVVQGLRTFARLVLIEGSRLEAGGDLAGALDWYVALLRSGRHCGKKGLAIERIVACGLAVTAMKRIRGLVVDPRLDPGSLRRLLDALVEADAMTPPASDPIKAEYLMLIRSFADPAFEDPCDLLPTYAQPTAWATEPGRSAVRLVRRLKKEPERSRRAYRLIVANWLNYCDRPRSGRPTLGPVGPPATPATPLTVSRLLLYPVGPDAPEDLRRLTPEDLDGWYQSSLYLRFLLTHCAELDRAMDADRLAMANQIVAVANELCKKDRGQYPPRVGDLVGPYLKSLPEAYDPPL